VFIVASSADARVIGSTMLLVSVLCLLPALLVVNAITTPMYALAFARYVDDPRVNVFFEVASLFEQIQINIGTTVTYVLNTAILWAVTLILVFIPIIGWIAAGALFFPVQAVLIAQYARAVLGSPGDVLARPEPPPHSLPPRRR
jgi:hypothetical protein